jgi:hypothetical protein
MVGCSRGGFRLPPRWSLTNRPSARLFEYDSRGDALRRDSLEMAVGTRARSQLRNQAYVHAVQKGYIRR